MARYRFDDCELDAERYALCRDGREVSMRPKVFEVLRYLVDHRERLVTKGELLQALWPDCRVNESAVPWAISFARRAIGQDTHAKHPIETVHGRGYRFVAQVDVIDADPSRLDGAELRSTARATAEALLELLALDSDERVHKSARYRDAVAKLARLSLALERWSDQEKSIAAHKTP